MTAKKKTATKKDESASSFATGVLSFSRSLQIGEGTMSGVSLSALENAFPEGAELPECAIPIEIVEKGVRGQTSNKIKETAKNGKAGASNIQTVEAAHLPQDSDALLLNFNIRVLPMSLSPNSANDPEVFKSYEGLAQAYANAGGYKKLAAMYVANIANGRFAWRNRMQSDRAVVALRYHGKELRFDPLMLSLDELASPQELADALIMGDAADIEEIINLITVGLTEKPFNFQFCWMAEMTSGAEVFPSQEYIREEILERAAAKRQPYPARCLASLRRTWNGRSIRQASVHSQKCGAALRHIDIWHGRDEYGPVSVNAYAGVQETGEALRPVKGENFYKIREGLSSEVVDQVALAETPDQIPDAIHFFMANLIRGGVYGE